MTTLPNVEQNTLSVRDAYNREAVLTVLSGSDVSGTILTNFRFTESKSDPLMDNATYVMVETLLCPISTGLLAMCPINRI